MKRSPLEIFKLGLKTKIWARKSTSSLIKSSEVWKHRLQKIDMTIISFFQLLSLQLKQRNYPEWTAWYVPYSDVNNDLFGKSHFNHQVDGINYHVLRTGAFPLIKFHCSKRPYQDLTIEDKFYLGLKILNFGNFTHCNYHKTLIFIY